MLFDVDNDMFRAALFQKYRIRECTVRLVRLNEEEIPKSTPKLLLKASGNVRSNSNISWFPASSTVRKNSDNALSALVIFQNQNGVIPRVAGRSEYFL